MRRSSPRPVAAALEDLVAGAEPATVLARAQACWSEVVGAAVAAEAEPVAERGGVLEVACRSAVWAQELQLLAGDVVRRLNAALGGGDLAPLSDLRVRTGGLPDPAPRGRRRRIP